MFFSPTSIGQLPAMRRILVASLLLIVFSPFLSQTVRAQSAVGVADLAVAYQFGQQFSVQARLSAVAPITDLSILYRAQGEPSTRSDHVSIDPDGHINYINTFSQGPLRPFARVDFWFHVTLQTGEQLDTSPFYFYYNDDRFPWQMQQDGNIRVHWYAGDQAFAREALDAARSGLQSTGTMLSITLTQPVDIYIYAIAADLQTALAIDGETWSNGHASPDLGVALVSISPGLDQSVEIERQIPHELAHVLTYEVTGSRSQYKTLPIWLTEGIASMAETPNPDYPRSISQATEKQALIPLADLCLSFPPDMSRVTLAYAESESFVRFIVKQYGNSGLQKLIHAYMDGLDCQQGTLQALGSPLATLETDWWRSAGVNNDAAVLAGLFPYIGVLTIVLFVPLVLVALFWRKPYGDDGQLTRK